MKTQYSASKISLAVALGLVTGSLQAQQQDNTIDEVVTTGSRLQGTAAAVIAERKNQAFVADILGSDQIARTGDSDAASALRRVTGLTLVDGKFIYVRGLGERYSSARLNGASIPSPDLTRNVIPLDIFPTNVIESLAVQKAFSPNMPAAFGGGSVDIRTKSLPSEFVAGIQLGIEGNSNNSGGFTYSKNDSGLPDDLESGIVHYRGDFSFRNIIEKHSLTDNDNASAFQQAFTANQGLLKSLPRNMALTDESLSPNMSFQGGLGNSYEEDWLGGTFGFLASVAYDNKWNYTERTNAVVSADKTDDCATSFTTAEDVNNTCYDSITDSKVTTENERINGLLTLGYRLDTHEVSYSKIYIQDNEDETEIGINQNPSQGTTIAVDNEADRQHQFTFEERELEIDQFKGQHTFLDWWGLGADWQYTESEVHTDIPLDVTYNFSDSYLNNEYQDSVINGGNGNANYQFIEMRDFMKSWGGNFNLPFSTGKFDIELKTGWDYSDRARYYTTSSFFVNNNGAGVTVNEGIDGVLGLSAFLTDDFIDNNEVWVSFNEPEAPEADDYLAAQKVQAGYGSFDIFYDNTWRMSGGLRYESFQQVTLESSSLIFSREDIENFYSQERIQDRTINEDDIYPALSLTYIGGDDYQVRLGYGETVVRPDLREVVPVGYFDPLTDIRTTGSLSLASSQLKNYDARYELYGDNGDNLALSLFYKDIANPIETVLAVGDSSYTATFTNGTSAELYGVEAEWLYDLTSFADGFFTSGNLTLSDSEVIIEAADAGNLTNKVKRMNGHSKYVVNLQLNYDSANGEHSGSLVYNVFGERILASGIGGRGDAYEQPFHSLDAIYTWYPDFNTKVKFKMKNLLGKDQEVLQSGVAVRTREIGTTFGVSYSYEF
ncbi:TonB-dependent receptor plug domain-containing protein [Paraglaciecola aquimarina]|uniref:TonB-dependent receptor plug domain-containing protein n=1 Tax=Paraglaciecola algarum TaxID=3050085 RepID=A0ABS9D5V7_9ALTE|nr:TonB-dependent receptor plug domain-containing protein [Paraglaciecola sp. G1-23]MCF2948290.1 TonB-dependent receptor plug domain-containing protein [Paraglaciecola sp. G1-23]